MERFLSWTSPFVVSHAKQSCQKMFWAVRARAALSAATAGELETIKTVGPPDACGASRSWHQLAEWEQCGEIDSARLMVAVGSLTIKGPQCPDPRSVRPPGL